MGILDSLGVGDIFGSGALQKAGTWASYFFVLVAIIAVVGIVSFIFFLRKTEKQSFKHQIPLFQNINGKYHRIGVDNAKEVFVPDSNISLFFLKKNKIYIARPTRAMGKNEWWYSISENGEWVNFDLTTDKEKNTLAQANYDHRDTRYAYVNLKDIIKKNYKDKSVKWWKDPVIMNMVTFIIMSFIFVGACWILLGKIGDLITHLGPLSDTISEASEKLVEATRNMQNLNSGVIQS